MAEKKEKEDNPFSFKTFVSGKERKTPTTFSNDIFSDASSEGVEGTVSSTIGRNRGERHQELNNSTSGASKTGAKKSKPKENPFSFKKFLSSSTNGGASNDILGGKVTSGSSSAAADGVNQISSPDFLSTCEDEAAPYFSDTLHVDLLEESANGISPLGKKPHGNSKSDIFIDSEDEGAAGDDVLVAPARDLAFSNHSGPTVLPDFLSDGAALSASSLGLASSMTSSTHDDLLSQIRMLQEQNTCLKRDLAAEKQRCSDKNQRLSQLQIDLERQKKKEAEETKVMEKAVLQVEENLVATTKRAVQAEATVVKLKQEIKTLQSQVKVLTLENKSYQSGDGGLSDIRERTKYTAEQLHSASAAAERNIKELSAGVEKLKLLSQVLSSLEKVTEVKPELSPEKDSSTL